MNTRDRLRLGLFGCAVIIAVAATVYLMRTRVNQSTDVDPTSSPTILPSKNIPMH
jgi:hypothetical protein